MTKMLHHFLLIYSHADGRLVASPRSFDDEMEAAVAYTRAEAEYRDVLENFEIVLVGSDNINTVMRTHGHYFATDDRLTPFAVPQPAATL